MNDALAPSVHPYTPGSRPRDRSLDRCLGMRRSRRRRRTLPRPGEWN